MPGLPTAERYDRAIGLGVDYVEIDVQRTADDIQVLASARSFLHSQVRSMVGALALVGEGRWTADDISTALRKRDRAACAPVAPPDGLYLARVDYA